jgi:hypothetical protein
MNIKRFFKKNKRILIIMSVTMILLLIVFYALFAMFIMQREQVATFLYTKEMSSELYPVTILSMLFFLLATIFFSFFTIFCIKIFFPNLRSFRSLFLPNDRQFLRDLPQQIRKEVFRNE